MDRKRFIHTGIRMLLLGAMAGLIAFFYRKDKLSLYSDCPAGTGCTGCNKLKSCTLPRAENLKNHGQEKGV